MDESSRARRHDCAPPHAERSPLSTGTQSASAIRKFQVAEGQQILISLTYVLFCIVHDFLNERKGFETKLFSYLLHPEET